MFKHLTVILAFLMALSSPIVAQDFEKGIAAFNAGDYATAFKEWKPLAEKDDMWAQNNLGVMYKNGYGVPQDYSEAVKWYRLAAEQGYDGAQNNLGHMYGNGLGVPKDYAEAIKWFRLAAEQGNAGAQSMLDKVLAEIEDQKRKDKDYKDLMESSDKRAEELGISKEVLEAITKRINKAIDEAINPRWDPNDLLKLAPFGECMNCNLQGANLERADLRGANLENANLDGANLSWC